MAAPSSFLHPHPGIRRELVELLYTSLPQVVSINVAAVAGAVMLFLISGDIGYAVSAFFIFLLAAVRTITLLRFKSRNTRISDADVVRWERIYAAGVSAFALALGSLSYRALEIGDAPGAWIAFGLSMSFCVGMISRAAVRPWVVLLTSVFLLSPTVVAGLLRPEITYKLGASMLVLFWFMLQEASRHLSTTFIERLEAKHELQRQASRDFLTGLPNRAAFLAALQDATGSLAVIAIDLDDFKPVNDRHGHQAGDDLLRQVAERLAACVGEHGIASRFGGDEFMLLAPVATGEAGRDAALKLAQRAILTLSMPYLVSDLPVRIGASAGILVTQAARSPGAVSLLLEKVDRALYAAKRGGGGRSVWSDEDEAQRQAG
jgi:diguanylate cyclase (GGDEF)-like protein